MESNATLIERELTMCQNPTCVYCEKPITGIFSFVFGEPMHRECETRFVHEFYGEDVDADAETVYDEHEPFFAEYEPAYV